MCFLLGAIADSVSFQRNDHYVATSLVQTSLVNLFGSGMIFPAVTLKQKQILNHPLFSL